MMTQGLIMLYKCWVKVEKIIFAKTNDLNSKYFISHKNKGFSEDMYSNKGFKVIKSIKVDNIEINRILIRDN